VPETAGCTAAYPERKNRKKCPLIFLPGRAVVRLMRNTKEELESEKSSLFPITVGI